MGGGQNLYQQALQIKIEYQDRYAQASTYHNLGMVAEEQRKWERAQDYYLLAYELITMSIMGTLSCAVLPSCGWLVVMWMYPLPSPKFWV